jgi:hypothetical protein
MWRRVAGASVLVMLWLTAATLAADPADVLNAGEPKNLGEAVTELHKLRNDVAAARDELAALRRELATATRPAPTLVASPHTRPATWAEAFATLPDELRPIKGQIPNQAQLRGLREWADNNLVGLSFSFAGECTSGALNDKVLSLHVVIRSTMDFAGVQVPVVGTGFLYGAQATAMSKVGTFKGAIKGTTNAITIMPAVRLAEDGAPISVMIGSQNPALVVQK